MPDRIQNNLENFNIQWAEYFQPHNKDLPVFVKWLFSLPANEKVEAVSQFRQKVMNASRNNISLWGIWAASLGFEDEVRKCLQNPAFDLNYEYVGQIEYENGDQPQAVEVSVTPLHAACWNGHENVVTLLLADSRVNATKADKHGWTAFMIAIKNGFHTIGGKILAYVNALATSQVAGGQQPLASVSQRPILSMPHLPMPQSLFPNTLPTAQPFPNIPQPQPMMWVPPVTAGSVPFPHEVTAPTAIAMPPQPPLQSNFFIPPGVSSTMYLQCQLLVQLREANAELRAENETLRAVNAKISAENASLKKRSPEQDAVAALQYLRNSPVAQIEHTAAFPTNKRPAPEIMESNATKVRRVVSADNVDQYRGR